MLSSGGDFRDCPYTFAFAGVVGEVSGGGAMFGEVGLFVTDSDYSGSQGVLVSVSAVICLVLSLSKMARFAWMMQCKSLFALLCIVLAVQSFFAPEKDLCFRSMGFRFDESWSGERSRAVESVLSFSRAADLSVVRLVNFRQDYG